MTFTESQLRAKLNPTPVRFRNRYERSHAVPGAGMTIPRRRPDHLVDDAGVEHRVKDLAIIWVDHRPAYGAQWECGDWQGELTWARPPKVSACPICRYSGKVVYYAKRDGYIKIGYTRQLAKRMASLNAIPLAVEPGERTKERERHEQFAHLRIANTEWFLAGPDLLEHIEALAS